MSLFPRLVAEEAGEHYGEGYSYLGAQGAECSYYGVVRTTQNY